MNNKPLNKFVENRKSIDSYTFCTISSPNSLNSSIKSNMLPRFSVHKEINSKSKSLRKYFNNKKVNEIDMYPPPWIRQDNFIDIYLDFNRFSNSTLDTKSFSEIISSRAEVSASIDPILKKRRKKPKCCCSCFSWFRRCKKTKLHKAQLKNNKTNVSRESTIRRIYW